MFVLGLNLTTTSDGLELFDGAAAMVINGEPVVAIAEERLSRIKHCGGVANAVEYCLAAAHVTIDQVHVAVSICCDEPPTPEEASDRLSRQGIDVDPSRIIVCPSHHLAHAASSFLASPFDEAIAVIADNEGVILGNRFERDYWRNALERTTIWYCRRTPSGPEFTQIAALHSEPNVLGFGAAYNYVTKWLGFSSYHDAGQTMALAAFHNGRPLVPSVFEGRDAGYTCNIKPSHGDKASAVAEWLSAHGRPDIASPRTPGQRLEPIHVAVAAAAQTGLQQAMLELVREVVHDTGVRQLCLAGGVALNCVNNNHLATSIDVELFVQPAASDIGQALGNALWAANTISPDCRRWTMTKPGLGKTYQTQCVQQEIERRRHSLCVLEPTDFATSVAELLIHQGIVGWFSGPSEYGLRSLGHRSILADPRTPESKKRLDASIKKREWFRPYAPSVLAEHAPDWFDASEAEIKELWSPTSFMLRAVQVHPDCQPLVPAVVHADGSARIHVVHRSVNPELHAVIEAFYDITGVPMVLNTSFNLAGNPIVETPADAFDEFLAMRLDALAIDNKLITEPAEGMS